MTSTPPVLRIALIGECMIELQEDAAGHIRQNVSGDTFNTALYMARLLDASAHEVHYITALGRDRFSEKMLTLWQQEGINVDQVRRFADKIPGLYYVEIDTHGERSFLYWRNDSAAKYLLEGTEFDAQLDSLKTFDCIYLSGISLAILPEEGRVKLLSYIKSAQATGCKICFDNNYRPRLWSSIADTQYWYQQMLSVTDIAILTFDDEQALWGSQTADDVFQRSQQFGVKEVVIKRGTQSCLIEKNGASRESIDACVVPSEKIVDTNAAGDSFSAAYLVGRMQGLPVSACASLGHRLASTVIQYRGAIIPKNVMP